MNEQERLSLKKLMAENNHQETTELIRKTKHSSLIKEDVLTLNNIKAKYARLAKTNPNEYDMLCKSKCSFLYNNYTDLFNKVKKSEVDLNLLGQFLSILKDIEDGKLDESDGSYKVGSILKKIYIDSAIQKNENMEKQKNKKKQKKPDFAKEKKISWSEFKAMKGTQTEK
tara:strand:+ start:2799 stop:3308 length:510 start_codon:yes stop_codon:yes gene_type:complete